MARRVALAARRKAEGYTQEGFAEALRVDRSSVARWESGDTEPQPWHRPKMARLLGVSTQELGVLIDASAVLPREDLIAWLASHTGRRVEDVARAVARHRPAPRRPAVRSEIAGRLQDFYGVTGRYGTSVVPMPWPLSLTTATFSRDRMELAVDFDAAVARIAQITASGARVVDAPLYQLVGPDTFAVCSFFEYALTLDALEAEPPELRPRLLPDLAAVLDVSSRLCVGGVVVLFAFARGDDVVLLVQRRGGTVLNGASLLSVIPKAFHQPLVDPVREAPLAATVLREMEEELFGRGEVDASGRLADPMHATLLSEPLAWLIARPETWLMELVESGINLVSGNFEAAVLVLVHDPQWWELFGGAVEANWETDRLHLYSASDTAGLAALVEDSAWSNEGLFAFRACLERLYELGVGT